MRFWRKNTGPGEAIRVTTVMARVNSPSTGMATAVQTRSSARFTAGGRPGPLTVEKVVNDWLQEESMDRRNSR